MTVAEFEIYDGMNDVNELMDMEITLNHLVEKLKRQESIIKQLKQDKHKQRQDMALLRREVSILDVDQKVWFNRAVKAERKIYDIDNKYCNWGINDEYEDGLIYYTDCKMDWYLTNDSNLEENNMNFCPKCGKKIKKIV